jgi:hypothetical protein
MDSSIVPDDSCEVMNYTDYEDEDDYCEDSDDDKQSQDEEDKRDLY